MSAALPIGVGFEPLRDKSYRQTRMGGDIVAFLAWCELGGMSPKTLINYEPDLARGALMFPDKGIEDITGDDDLQILLGHASINTTASIYVHTRIADVAERMRTIEMEEAR